MQARRCSDGGLFSEVRRQRVDHSLFDVQQPGVAAIPGVQLTHFIRSGGYFIPKINDPYSPIAKFAFKWVPGLQRVYRFNLFLEVSFAL